MLSALQKKNKTPNMKPNVKKKTHYIQIAEFHLLSASFARASGLVCFILHLIIINFHNLTRKSQSEINNRNPNEICGAQNLANKPTKCMHGELG